MTAVPTMERADESQQERRHRRSAATWKAASVVLGVVAGSFATILSCGDRIAKLRDGITQNAIDEQKIETWREGAKAIDIQHAAKLEALQHSTERLNDAVPAIVELQLQQGEDLRSLLIESAPRAKQAGMRRKAPSLERAETAAKTAADSLSGKDTR